MSDLLEHDLREAFADRVALITPEAGARLRATDYHPRSRSLPSRPALGVLGLSGVAAAAGAAILLGSSAAPAFAGWTARPTSPRPGQLAGALHRCETGAGAPVLTDTRGPYTASIYANGSTCLEGDGVAISARMNGGGKPDITAGKIELDGVGESDSAGHALTMVDGQIGGGVTGVDITRSDGTSVQATVKNGWYLAWWPGTEHAVTAQVTSASGTSTQSFPAGPYRLSPTCPPGGNCASSYGFGTGPGNSRQRSSSRASRGSSGTASGGGSSSISIDSSTSRH